MKVNWMTIQSVSELKTLGGLKEVKEILATSIGTDQLLTGNSFESVFQKLSALQQVVKTQDTFETETNEKPTPTASYFNSLTDEYLFYLLELEGELRMKKLGITRQHFSNSKVAKQWYRSLAKMIHPDVCHHPNATLAMNQLTQLYREMGGKESTTHYPKG